MKMNAISSLGNGVSGVVIGAYIGAVIYQSFGSGGTLQNSNLTQLLTDLEQDYGYLEFLIAAGVIKVLYDIPALHDIVLAFVVLTVIGMLLTKAPGSSILNYLQSFGAGKIGLFGEKASVPAVPVKSAAGATIGV